MIGDTFLAPNLFWGAVFTVPSIAAVLLVLLLWRSSVFGRHP
ncbi:hypothetical protein PO002_31260 [Cupriavidus necator]